MSQQEFSESLDRLTPKQREVLSRILAGEPDAEIAASLEIKLATVRKHVQRIYQAFESFISSEQDDRRSRRGDLIALFAKYKPELLRTGTPVDLDRIIDEERNSLASLPNPFVPLTGRVDMQQQFFGREREIQRIFETLNSGSSVAVIGDREIGKSSLLWAICQEAESKMTSPRKPIYINLQYILDDNDFYEALCYEVGIDVCKGYSLNRALRQQRPRLLLVLDEVEKMTWDGFTNQLRAQLRGLAEGGDAPLRLVVAASTSLDELFPDNQAMGMTSPFTNICIEERINAWDEATVREFISHRLATTQILFEEDDISQIVRESGGHPKQLMQLCYQTYEGYKEKML